ncbi:uncharacterized protein LOC127248166 [Andrographis paniculata]|uniref:uncharacterized protein LOC127248166 n=1 Tax=Andrographis paniculata TaxID=175694 RepID=UPI0021E7C175|nr:uncharacterized protein LOC127248166 [Andrographis paniculata]
MHFPWKKAMRSTRLSRLVNDHLHNSQKRRDGSSLVVETGFPTSLVDLFIKNREKLKKPSRRKRRSILPATPLPEDPACFASPPPAPAPSPMSPLSSAGPGSPAPSLHCPPVLESSSGEVNGIPVVCGDSRRDFLVVLKIILVVCFAVGNKKLTAGIAVTAVLLLFLEHLGRYACRFCSEGVLGTGSIVERIRMLLRFKEVKLDWNLTDQDHSSKSESFNQEIQFVETDPFKIHLTSRSCPEATFRRQEVESKAALIEEEGAICEVVEFKKAKSRRAKVRSKMKKFFSEKLRRSRKVHDDSQRLEEEEEEEVSVFLWEEYQESDKAEEEEEMSSGLPEYVSETVAEIQHKGEEIKGGARWKQFVLCVIVLTGLIGGRAFALLLTLSSCLLFKLSMKVPVIRYFFSH